MKTLLVATVALSLLASPAWAASKTVTLAVPGMFCATCPIVVKKALTKVTGVTEVNIDLDKKQAMVTFDDTKADTATLTKATTNAGYPSTVTTK